MTHHERLPGSPETFRRLTGLDPAAFRNPVRRHTLIGKNVAGLDNLRFS